MEKRGCQIWNLLSHRSFWVPSPQFSVTFSLTESKPLQSHTFFIGSSYTFFSWLFSQKNNIVLHSHLLLTSRQLESRCSTTCKPLRRNSACTTPGLGWVCWKIRSKRPSIVRRRPDGRCSTAMTRWGVWFRMGSEMVELQWVIYIYILYVYIYI